MWDVFQIPFDIIFAGADCSWDTQAKLNLTIDLIFLFDMLISFNTAYYDDMALLVRERQAIVLNYLRYSIASNGRKTRASNSFREAVYFHPAILLQDKVPPDSSQSGRGWFFFDLVSSMPFDRLACAIRSVRRPFISLRLREHD
jgi:hypothetical protein